MTSRPRRSFLHPTRDLLSYQPPQHILQNPAIGVVQRFLWGVDADDGFELDRLYGIVFADGVQFHCASGGEFLDYVADAGPRYNSAIASKPDDGERGECARPSRSRPRS